MERINNNNLKEIKGGGTSTWAIAGLVGVAVTFLVGVIDGYFRPNKCLKK